PVSKAGRSVISRLEGIGKQAELRSAVEDLGPTLKADEWKSVAYEVTGRNFPSGKQARQAVLDRLSDRLLMDERVEGVKRLFGRGEQAAPAPRRKEVGSTLTDFARASSATEIAERFNIMQEDAASLLGRNAFTGEAKTVVERLAKKAAEANAHVLNNDWEALGQVVGDMAADAAVLTELDARPEARLITQWVDTASRLAREGNIAVPERAEAAPQTVEQKISDAYWRLTKRPQDWVMMRNLRADLKDIPRAEFDAAIKSMYLSKAINVSSEDDQGSLTQADRDASFRLGPTVESVRVDKISMQAPVAAQAAEPATNTQTRQSFASILNSKTPRSKWASTLGISEEQLAPLIDEAVRKGFLRRDKNGNVRRVPQSQKSGSFAAMVIPENLPDTIPGVGNVVLTPKAQERWGDIIPEINRAVSGIIPEAVQKDFGDNIAIATLRREDQMLAIREETAFRRWFGDSKVVDENGKPLVVYHGTRKDIEQFRKESIGSATGEGWLGEGFYFSPHEDVAAAYGPNVVSAYLSIKNPFYFPENVNPIRFVEEKGGSQVFTDWVKAQGHDGIISTRVLVQTVAFDPTQIKSTANRGTFDPTDPRISYALRTGRGQTESDPSAIVEGEESASGDLVAIADEMRETIASALASGDGYNYGLRVTDAPLAVGETAPPSRTWYSDFISEEHDTFGREAFPDHDTPLSGSSAIGLRDERDIEAALRAADVTPMKYLVPSPYGHSLYLGAYVSLVRSEERTPGNDPGEWILPNAEVVQTWTKSPPSEPSEGSLSLEGTNVAENRAATGREGVETGEGQPAPGGTAATGEGIQGDLSGDLDARIPDRALARIIRQESASLDADGNIIAGRPSRSTKASRKSREGVAIQRAGKAEPFNISGFDGRVRAEKLTDRDAREGNLARLTYEIFETGTMKASTIPLGEMEITQRSDGAWEVGYVEIRAPRNGIGSKLYGAVEKDLGIRMSPSGVLSESGYAFWNSRSPASVQWHVKTPTFTDEAGKMYFSPRKITDEMDRIGRELKTLSTGAGWAMKLSPTERETFRKAYVKERGQLLALYGSLPLEARARNVRDSMFALRG
ncbi:MAG TPA: hypothetical protein VKA31_00915, partial [Mariprofundaceae bacterium]|nr:hypothetical protein [Mariprofundaceae bacterium]